MQTEQLTVTGMTCGGCTSSVKKALEALYGVKDVIVSLSTGQATVQYDEILTSPQQLKLAVKEAGYGLDASNTTTQPQTKGCCG